MQRTYVRVMLLPLLFICSQLLAQSITPVTVANLPQSLHESSGLVYIKPYLWTLADSGNSRIYALSLKNGQVIKTVKLLGALNRDWESLTVDRRFVYVGDIGNNNGSRKRLVIYRFPRYILQKKQASTVQTIYFHYPSRQQKATPYAHDFDAEALVATPTKLLVVTKNWKSGNATVFSVPKQPGQYTATRLYTINSPGLITAAALLDRHCWFLGYLKNPFNFHVFLGHAVLGSASSSKTNSVPARIYAVNLRCQAEALAVTGSIGWLTCEGGRHSRARLFRFHLPGKE